MQDRLHRGQPSGYQNPFGAIEEGRSHEPQPVPIRRDIGKAVGCRTGNPVRLEVHKADIKADGGVVCGVPVDVRHRSLVANGGTPEGDDSLV